MALTLFILVAVLATVVLLLEAGRDIRILLKGGFDEDTNPTDVPVDQLVGLAKNSTFIRTVAAVRLIFAAVMLLAMIYHFL
jgi:hypothetical protein